MFVVSSFTIAGVYGFWDGCKAQGTLSCGCLAYAPVVVTHSFRLLVHAVRRHTVLGFDVVWVMVVVVFGGTAVLWLALQVAPLPSMDGLVPGCVVLVLVLLR